MKRLLNLQTKMILGIVLSMAILLSGCGNSDKINKTNENNMPENVILTETGEMLEKDEQEVVPSPSPSQAVEETAPETSGIVPEITADLTPITPHVDFVLPETIQTEDKEAEVENVSSELQLVFLGDSIFDSSRDGTGVPYLTAKKCEANLYNLAIGGTSASIEIGEPTEAAQWTSRSLCGVVQAMKKEIPTDIFAGSSAQKILDNPNVDFTQTDYFIVEYGLNDYFRAVPLTIEGTNYDVRCYSGALRYSVEKLREIAPDATIILCAPTYARFFNSDGFMIGDGNVSNTGYGTLFDYKGSINYVANDCQTLFFNAYQDLGINGYTADDYLEDGVHLTEAGRELYADALSKIILNYEETKNN